MRSLKKYIYELSRNATVEDVEADVQLDLYYSLVSASPYISAAYILATSRPWDRAVVLARPDLTWDMVCADDELMKSARWGWYGRNPNLTWAIVKNWPNIW